MAAEVSGLGWLHSAPPTFSDDGDDDEPAPFAFNPLHGLESLLWLLVYVLLHSDDMDNLSDSKRISERETLARTIFVTRPDSSYRNQFLQSIIHAADTRAAVAASFAPAFSAARKISSILVHAYRLAEAKFGKIQLKECLVHHQLRPILTEPKTLEAIRNIKLTPVKRVAASVAVGSGKRKNAPCNEEGQAQKEPKSKRTR